MTDRALVHLNREIVACERCERLLRYCSEVARVRRRAFADETYHGRPVPNFLAAKQPSQARMLIVGLAPAAHGANRTGRMFTGDRSGDFLFEALHQTGFANQAECRAAGDGLELSDVCITAAVHCAPPANKPLPEEFAACGAWLDQTISLLPRLRVVMCLGRLALSAAIVGLSRAGHRYQQGASAFGHGAVIEPMSVPLSEPRAVMAGAAGLKAPPASRAKQPAMPRWCAAITPASRTLSPVG